jgi:hypothetical protein
VLLAKKLGYGVAGVLAVHDDLALSPRSGSDRHAATRSNARAPCGHAAVNRHRAGAAVARRLPAVVTTGWVVDPIVPIDFATARTAGCAGGQPAPDLSEAATVSCSAPAATGLQLTMATGRAATNQGTIAQAMSRGAGTATGVAAAGGQQSQERERDGKPAGLRHR